MNEEPMLLSDNIIVWLAEDNSIRITQMIDDSFDVDEEVSKISAGDPTLTFKFKGKLSEIKIPIHGIFYGAVTLDENNDFVYDMTKARNIWRNRLRRLREPRFAELDLAYQRADENDDEALKKEIVNKKNILRDCTAHPGIDAATNIFELRKVIPEMLAD